MATFQELQKQIIKLDEVNCFLEELKQDKFGETAQIQYKLSFVKKHLLELQRKLLNQET